MNTKKINFLTSILNFIKATVIGGLLFLLPLVLLMLVLTQALQFAKKIVQPISENLHLADVFGIGVLTLLSVFILILISFCAGVIARTRHGKWLTTWIEESMLGGLPQYQMIKSMTAGLAHIENEKAIKPALVCIEGGWQIGYLLEVLENNWVAVFLPQAPTPMSGNIMYFSAERVRPLEISMTRAMLLVKHIGVGSGELLKGIDLTLPEGEF